MTTLNIGLKHSTGIHTPEHALATLQRFGIVVHAFSVRDSNTEPTLVVHVNDSTNVWEVSEALDQDCIAVFSTTLERGGLFGPRSEKWLPFNPKFFLSL